MKFDVYCDESHPDAFTSQSVNKARYLLIGSLWLPADLRATLKKQIQSLRDEQHFFKEIKWHKVHRRYDDFYKGLINIFLGQGDLLRFRCIAVDSTKVDMVRFHHNDKELGFYKFYYQVLHQWILPFNEYKIFCDEKTNREGGRLKTLHQVLCNANLSSDIQSVQALPSKELDLIQMVDFFLGIASSRLNETIGPESFKNELICYLEQRLGLTKLAPTPRRENKFNIFKIELQGGW